MQYIAVGTEHQARVDRLKDAGWLLHNGDRSLEKSFNFRDFKEAWEVMEKVAEAAEARGHHPDWHNVYNRLNITWNTHDASFLTTLDLEMAELCEKLAAGVFNK
jgi:4a-hydroxytetrahydrobiopterin dehydratase